MRRVLYIIILALLPTISYAQSIADLTRKAEIEKNPLHIYSSIGSYNNGLYIVHKNNDEDGTYAYGVVNESGTVYIPVVYDRIEFTNEYGAYEDNVYKCEKKGKWGLVSSTNGTLLPCEYSSLSNVGNGIWRTSKNGKSGYVQLNRTSSITTLIPCIYESLEDYSSDSYIHATLKGKKGMIDSKNNTIIPFEYSFISDLCHTSNGNSIVWVEKDGKHGIYSYNGKELQPCDIEKAYIQTDYNHKEELSYTDCPLTTYIYIVRNGMTGVISGSTFESLVPCMYEYLSPIKADKAFYKANGKWGIIDTSNKAIQLAIYDNIEIDGSNLSEQNMPSKAFQSDMYVRCNSRVGMLKANGEDFIPVKYDSLGVYSDDMLEAKVGSKYGFLNEEGKEAVPFIYSQVHDYSEGLAAVVNENGKYLFIDKLGNVAIKPKEYDRVDKFTNGTCKVYRKDKFWEIDREGKKVKDSKKKVEVGNVDENKSNDDMYVENSENVSDTNTVYDKDLAPTPTVISTSQPNNIQLSQNFSSNISKYDAVLGNFSDGLLPVTKNKKLGYINAEGEEVIPCTKKYYIEPGMDDGIVKYGSFHDGLAQVYSFEGESGAIEFQGAKNIKIGYMNKLGETVIPAIYDYADDFSEGKAYVRSNDFQGFIDTTGKRLFQCKQSPTDMFFSDGLVLISDYDDGKYIFYNSEGKIALEIPTDKYFRLHGFNDGLAYYEKINNETGGIGEKGFIDKSGKEILVLSEFYVVNDFSEGLASVSKDGEMYGFINTKGDLVIPCKYKGYIDEGDIRYFHDFHDGVCLIEAEDSLYFINKKNEVVLNIT